MQHYHVQNLPTPINPNKLEIFLKDYDQNSRSMLSKGFEEGFLIQSIQWGIGFVGPVSERG
jgi:hypothetical protein